jgi:hypothetical protein
MRINSFGDRARIGLQVTQPGRCADRLRLEAEGLSGLSGSEWISTRRQRADTRLTADRLGERSDMDDRIRLKPDARKFRKLSRLVIVALA